MNKVLQYKNYYQWVELIERSKNCVLKEKNINFNLFSSDEEKKAYEKISNQYESFKTKSYYLKMLENELKTFAEKKDNIKFQLEKCKFFVLQPLNYMDYIKSLALEEYKAKSTSNYEQFGEESERKISYREYHSILDEEYTNLSKALNKEKEKLFLNTRES